MKIQMQTRWRKLKAAGRLLLLLACCTAIAPDGKAQSFPEGIHYQAVLRDASGNEMFNQLVDVQIRIIANTMNGTVLYEEVQSTTTSLHGHVALVIGQGTPTAGGTTTDFSTIDWTIGAMFINLQVDEGATGTFVDVLTTQFFSTPYAMHSKTTDQTWQVPDLTDVNTSGIQPGHTLIWDGSQWNSGMVTPACDTVAYATNAGTATYADTATVALTAVSVLPSDTAQFAWYGDTANYVSSATTAIYADSAAYADTALIAMNCFDGWSRMGNNVTAGEFLGSTNAEDLVFQTNATEVMRLTTTGRVGLGTATPSSGLHVVSNEGVLFRGTFGAGTAQSFTGPRMVWYPRKGHFYAGDGTVVLNDANMGDYSFGTGYNVTPGGNYSTAMGFASLADGEASFAAGFDSKAFGDYSVAVGHVSQANGEAGVAMGRGAWAHGEAAVALGYHPHATEAYSAAIGYQCEATDTSSFAFGYNAHSDHKGSFVFNCENGGTNLYSNADNQFMVRATGGTIFYSDAGATTGVILNPGAGSWSFLSDSTKKKNITSVDVNETLERLSQVEVSSWNYLSQDDGVRHVGPMAQDFYAAFGYGASDTTITTSDIDGVNLAALQALAIKAKQLEEKVEELDATKSEMTALRAERDELEKRIQRMELLIEAIQMEQEAKALREKASGYKETSSLK